MVSRQIIFAAALAVAVFATQSRAQAITYSFTPPYHAPVSDDHFGAEEQKNPQYPRPGDTIITFGGPLGIMYNPVVEVP